MSTHLYGAEHVRRYQATGGAEGYLWRNNTTILLLTTTGRKSGRPYTAPLIYRPYGDNAYTVVASKGGSAAPPDWLLNLQAQPSVTVQIREEIFPARARVAGDEEHPELWRRMAEVWPAYEQYQVKTDRPIAVVVLERTDRG